MGTGFPFFNKHTLQISNGTVPDIAVDALWCQVCKVEVDRTEESKRRDNDRTSLGIEGPERATGPAPLRGATKYDTK